MWYVVSAVLTLAMVPNAVAQGAARQRAMSEADEVALARSAAPPSISADATVLVLRGHRYVEAVKGASPVTCLVGRTWSQSLEPICYDGEAARTIMPMLITQVELRLEGVPREEVERLIESRIASGDLSVPARPAMAYMMSAGQVLYADSTTRVGRWQPHIHMYIPYATAEQFGGFSNQMVPAVGGVEDEGKPTANVVIRVREFVEPSR